MPDSNASATPRLLLVDDDRSSIMTMNQVLGATHDLRFATSGARALELIRESAPELILLDMVMPEMDGIETLRQIRAYAGTRATPVLIVTARNDAESESSALRAGADDFITKPINPDVLKARVFIHLEKHRLQQSSEQHLNRLAQRTNALTQANKELDAFSYSVSHDLRAPLRAIDGFSNILLKKYSGQLDDQGRELLERMRGATKRMGQLIDDMLVLSRISRAELVSEEFDLSNLAVEVVSHLREAFPERAVETVIQPDIHAHGDPKLIRIVLDNLLGNAWKFTGKTEHAKVELGSKTSDTKVEYFVRDNGAGFDMAFADKLFGAFQRLHSANEFQGSGIGLATVARVIHKHGGSVRAESIVGQGATFWFSLRP